MSSLLKKIQEKSRRNRFQKDDFQAYSDAQGQLDLLFDDVALQIRSMKKNLKNDFERVQSGRTNNRSRGGNRDNNRGGNRDDNRDNNRREGGRGGYSEKRVEK